MAQKINMLSGGLFKKIIVFTIPIMLQGLLQSIYNAADLAIVGQFSADKSNAVAAVGSTTSIYNVLIGFFMGLSVGVDVISSRLYGKGDHKGVKQVIDTAVILAPILGIIVAIVGFFVTSPVLSVMSTPTDGGVFDGACTYLKILMFGVPFSMMFNFISAIFRTAGETTKPFLMLAISGLVNVGLNFLFCGAFNLGVVGVAVATVISQMLSAVMIFIYLIINKGLFSFSFKKIAFSFEKLKRIVIIGMPAGLQSAAFSLSNTFLQSGVNSFNDADVNAGSAAVGTVEGLLWVTLNSFHNSTTTFMSQNVGAGNVKRAKKVLVYTLSVAGVLGLILGLGSFLLKTPILSIFIKDNPIAMEYGYQRLMYTFPLYFLAGIMGILPGAIRGFGYSLSPSLITLIGTCGVRILWVYTVFEAYHDLSVLYMVHPITWVLTITALLINYAIVLHIYKKKHTPKMTQ
ncbi:MAG: MATE family efflux transporter [Clostridia bacterium]|nr:MATE family efflux transporter [Clostridia bacterium]